MKVVETPLAGAYLLEPERIVDHRGFFGRIWCADELAEYGLVTEIAQTNVGFSHEPGTLRGLHFQRGEHAEVKLVRCTRGAVFDVIVDLRPDSATVGQWFGAELSESNHRMMYVPAGFAQGYLTLTPDAEIYYHTSQRYAPHAASGVRFDDPAFRIEWPHPIRVISDQDLNWPDYRPGFDPTELQEMTCSL